MNNKMSENWWFHIEPWEWWLCAFVFLGCIGLHFPAIYNPFGLYIEVGLSLISYASPISGILWLTAAQVVPDPPVASLSSSQIAVAGAMVWLVFKSQRRSLEACKPLLIAVGPYFCWQVTISFLFGGGAQLPLLLLFAILTGVVAAVMARQAENRIGTIIIAFLLGQALSACVFWIIKLHLGAPVQAFDTELYGDASEVVRMGTARGNAGMLGGTASLAVVGFFGLLMFRLPQGNRKNNQILLFTIALAGLCFVSPALIASGSRGGMISTLVGLIVLLLFAGNCRFLSLFPLLIGLAGVVLMLAVGWQRFGMNEHLNEMISRQEMQAEDAEHGALVAGREQEWEAAAMGVLDSPLIGGGHVVKKSYAGTEEYWASHSTYLDVGLAGGIPGLILFLWFCAMPIIQFWKLRNVSVMLWLISLYVVTLSVNSTGSALRMKHFWILWGMISIFAKFPFDAWYRARLKMRRAPAPAGRTPSLEEAQEKNQK